MRYGLLLALFGAVAPGCMSHSYMDEFDDRATRIENRVKGEIRECIEESRKEFEKYVDRMAGRFEDHVEREVAKIEGILRGLDSRTERDIRGFKDDLAELNEVLTEYKAILKAYGIGVK